MAGPVPDAGDWVWVEFDPAVGHEQGGRRPALVVSSSGYNSRSTYIVVCPITRSTKPWPFKVILPEDGQIAGSVLVDQIKSIDRTGRFVQLGGTVPDVVLVEVRAKLGQLLGTGSP